MAKKYTKNIKLEFAYQKVFSNINALESIPIHDVIILVSGDNLPKSKMKEGEYPVYGGGGATENKHNNYNIDYNSVGIGRVGARCGCIFEIKSNSWVTDNALYIKSYDERFYLPYLKHFLSFSNLNQYANNAMQPVISKTRIKNITIPLIDLDKQKDISILLDSIEFGRDCDIKGFEDLLNNVKVVDIWKDLVVEVEAQQTLLKKLRQSILQEAIEGKLTASWREQNPDIECASILLEKIKAEKEKVKDKKIKKQKSLPPINDNEIPFDIPDSWEWCRWQDLLSLEKHSMKRGPFGSSLTKDMFVKEGIKVYEQQNAIHDVDRERYFIAESKFKEMEAFVVKPYDLIISCSGATLGRISELHKDSKIGIINQALLKINLNNNLISNNLFIKLFRSLYFQNLILKQAWGSAIPNMIGVKELKKMLIALPPLEEQREIVKKIEKLFQICDELEIQINGSEANSEMLMQAVLKEAFEK